MCPQLPAPPHQDPLEPVRPCDGASISCNLACFYARKRSDRFMLVRDTTSMYQVSHYIGPRTKLAEPSRETGDSCLDQWTTFCTSNRSHLPFLSYCSAPSVSSNEREDCCTGYVPHLCCVASTDAGDGYERDCQFRHSKFCFVLDMVGHFALYLT